MSSREGGRLFLCHGNSLRASSRSVKGRNRHFILAQGYIGLKEVAPEDRQWSAAVRGKENGLAPYSPIGIGTRTSSLTVAGISFLEFGIEDLHEEWGINIGSGASGLPVPGAALKGVSIQKPWKFSIPSGILGCVLEHRF